MQTKGLSRYGGPPGGNPTNLLSNRLLQAKKDQQSSIKNIAQEVVTAPEVVRPASPAQSITATSVVTSVINPPGGKRVRVQPQVIQRTIFYQGAVYVIEEEMYSDSDNSSVYTSEDEFDDDPQIVGKFLDKLDEYNEVKAYGAEQERLRKLNPSIFGFFQLENEPLPDEFHKYLLLIHLSSRQNLSQLALPDFLLHHDILQFYL